MTGCQLNDGTKRSCISKAACDKSRKALHSHGRLPQSRTVRLRRLTAFDKAACGFTGIFCIFCRSNCIRGGVRFRCGVVGLSVFLLLIRPWALPKRLNQSWRDLYNGMWTYDGTKGSCISKASCDKCRKALHTGACYKVKMKMKYTAYIHSPMSIIGLQSRMLLCSTPDKGATYVDTALHDNVGLIIYHMRSILRRCGPVWPGAVISLTAKSHRAASLHDGFRQRRMRLYRHFLYFV